MTSMDCSDLTPEMLLEEPWCKSTIASFFTTSAIIPPVFKISGFNGRYVDYFCGRAIKTDFRKMANLSTLGYDQIGRAHV